MTVVLAEFTPWDPVAAATVTVRVTSHDDEEVTSLNGVTWWPALARKGRFTMDLFDGAFTGKLSPGTGEMELDLSAFPDAARYTWADKPARVWIGEVGDAWGDFTLLFDGLTQAATADKGRLKLPLRVNDTWLDDPLLTEEYEGTGGVEGAADLKGNPKELVIGAPKNVEARLVDAVNNVYQLSGYGAINGTVSAFDNGSAFPASFGNYASYAALIASGVTAGNFATSFAEGLTMLGAPGFGVITWDVEGDAAGPDGWVRLPGKVIKRLALIAGADVSQLNTTSLDALDVAVPRTISLQIKEQTPARTPIQTIAQSCNAGAGVSWLGTLFVSRIAFSTSVLTLKSDGSALPPVASVRLLEVASPFWRMQMSANRSWRVHDSGELAEDSSGDVAAVIETRPVTVYKRSYSKPTQLLNTESGVPAGTAVIAPSTGLGLLWMAQSLQETDGTVIGEWSDWVPVEQDPGFTIEVGPDTGTANDATYVTWLDGWRLTAEGSLPGDYASIVSSKEVFTGPCELYWQIHDPLIEQRMGIVEGGTRTATLASYGFGYVESAVAGGADLVVRPAAIPIVSDFDSNAIDYGPATSLTKFGIIYDGLYISYLKDGTPLYSEYYGPGGAFRMLFNSGSLGAGAYNVRFKSAAQREAPIEAIQLLGPLSFLNGIMRRYSPTGIDDWFIATFYTQRGFTGGAVAQGFVPDNTDAAVFGFHTPTADPTDPREANYCFVFNGDGTYTIKEGASIKQAATAFSNNDHFRITYSGTTMTYLVNGSSVATSAVASGLTLRLYGAINNHEGAIRDLVMAPVA